MSRWGLGLTYDKTAKEELIKNFATNDVVNAENGSIIERSFQPSKYIKADSKISKEKAISLISSLNGKSVIANQLMEAWLGRKTKLNEVEEFILQLEEMNLVRRDDNKRTLVWPITDQDIEREPTEEELALAEKLKVENPKGKLLEFCMRDGGELPTKLEDKKSGTYYVEYQFSKDGKFCKSGIHGAFSGKVAEHLAAKKLLEKLIIVNNNNEIITLKDSEAEDLKHQNPKGKLLEFCMQHKISPPSLKAVPVVGGFQLQTSLDLGDKCVVTTKTYLGKQSKSVEQAVAKDIIDSEKIQKYRSSEIDTSSSESDVNVGDPRTILNQLCQKGILNKFGYDDQKTEGSSHNPVFYVRAWAEAPGGVRENGVVANAPNKKKSMLLAASNLLDKLQELRWY